MRCVDRTYNFFILNLVVLEQKLGMKRLNVIDTL